MLWRSRLAGTAFALCLALGVGSAPAWAQAGGAGGGAGGGGAGGAGGGAGTGQFPGAVGTQPEQEVQQPRVSVPLPVPAPPYADTLFGDWGGVRTRLLNQGIDLRFDYTAEVAGNVSGKRKGFDYAHQFAFTADIDLQKLANIPGLSTHFAIINRAGRNLSSDYLGDNLSQAQEIFGATFDRLLYLVWFYGEEKLLNDRLNIAVGRIPMGVDFAASPLACIPIALTPQCGVPRALANSTAFTTWPQSQWAGRVRYRPTAETYVQTGLYQVRPFPAGGVSGWDWTLHGSTGLAVPVEIGWEPIFGPDKLPGHYKVGFIHDTSGYSDLLYNDLGQPLAFSTLPPGTDHGRNGFWIQGDQMLWRNGPGRDQGVIVLASYGHSSSNTSVTSDTVNIMLIDKGFIPSRPNDIASLSFGWFGISDHLRQLQEIDIASGLPVAHGSIGPQTKEYVLEADYTFPVYRGVTVQPGIQYFVNPNADRRVKNAVVFAGRLHISF
jgi:porin